MTTIGEPVDIRRSPCRRCGARYDHRVLPHGCPVCGGGPRRDDERTGALASDRMVRIAAVATTANVVVLLVLAVLLER